jgi:dephospho-CoA kinase
VSFVVGLTGGIGSGKSAAADEFAALGASVVDTDAIAHQLTEAGGAALPAIEQLFGAEFIRDGRMDRQRMRERVFSDPAAKKALEGLLHPMIREESQRRRVDRVLVVDAPEETQVARVRSRSRLAEDEVRAIIHTQASREARLAAADDVIDNGGSRDALRKQVAALHQKYLQFPKP